jgi:hypothetical protein
VHVGRVRKTGIADHARPHGNLQLVAAGWAPWLQRSGVWLCPGSGDAGASLCGLAQAAP